MTPVFLLLPLEGDTDIFVCIMTWWPKNNQTFCRGFFLEEKKNIHVGTQRLLTVQISCMQCFTKSVCTVTILRNNVFIHCLFLSDTEIDTDTEGLLFCKIL